MRPNRFCTTFCVGLMLATAGRMWSQDAALPPAAGPSGTTAKAPVRTARLAYFSGALQVQRSDNTGEDAAALNMPLYEGTRLLTGDYAQAEIEFEDGSVVRLTPRTVLTLDAMSLLEKSVAHTKMSLLGGLAYFELRDTATSTWSVEAGQVLATPTANVVLRVSLDQPPATFSVLSGSVFTSAVAGSDEEAPGFTANVKAGESLRADAEDRTRYFLNQQVAEESWDTWNQSRDQEAADDAGSRTEARNAYAAKQGYGWSDLDANGTWYSAPGTGAGAGDADGSSDLVWQPTGEDADFDPYGDGAFVWSGQGYLWASGYTWGWLPYRCGRWDYYFGLGWVWRPNRFCVVWGFGGGGDIYVGHRPPHYKVIGKPIPGPGPIHPIHRIHVPGTPQPRQPGAARSEVKVARIDGVVATPLLPVGRAKSFTAQGGEEPLVGGALFSDFPVGGGGQPVLGSFARPVGVSALVPAFGWTAHQGNAVTVPGESHAARVPGGASEARTATHPTSNAAPHPAAMAQHSQAAPAPAVHSAPAPAAASSSNSKSK